MNEIYTNNVKHFVFNDAERYISLGLLKQLAGAYTFISVFALVCVFFGKALLWNIALLVLTLLYIAGVLWFQKICDKINSFSLRFLVNGISAFMLSIYFLLLAFSFLSLEGYPVIWYLIILLCYLALISSYNFFTVLNVRNGRYSRKRAVKKNKLAFWVTTGALAGVNFIRLLKQSEDENINKISIAIFGCCVISFLSELGTVNFLKYYYCKKYLLTCDESGNNASLLLTHYDKKNKLKKKQSVMKVLFIIFIILVAIFLIIGIIINVDLQ